MKLIDILVRELPERGGWPEYGKRFYAVQDSDREVKFIFDGSTIKFGLNNKSLWGSDSPSSWLESNIPGVHFNALQLSSDFETAIVTREEYEAALAAYKVPTWNGDGLPPVGVECERSWAGDPWEKCVVNYIGVEFAVVTVYGRENTYMLNSVKFRPLRTEEDRKREEAVQEMEKIIIGPSQALATAGKIFDAIAAGKIPGIKLED